MPPADCGGTCRTGRHFLFVFFLFVFFAAFSRCGAGEVRSREVGVAGAVRAPRATGSSTNRSAASAAGDTAQSPSLFIPWRSRATSAVPNATRRVGGKNRSSRGDIRGNWGRVNLPPLDFPRAREACRRPTAAAPAAPAAISFLSFSFLSFSRCGPGEVRSREVGVAGAVRAPRATGSSTNRSAASAAGDTAQSPSLFIPWRSRATSAVPNATRRVGGKTDHHAETSGEIGGAVNLPPLDFPRAREACRRPTAAAPAAPAAISFLSFSFLSFSRCGLVR